MISSFVFWIQAQAEMRPITDAARHMVTSSSSFITAARNLCGNPDDKPNWQLLTQHGKAVADAMRRLLEEIVYVKVERHLVCVYCACRDEIINLVFVKIS